MYLWTYKKYNMNAWSKRPPINYSFGQHCLLWILNNLLTFQWVKGKWHFRHDIQIVSIYIAIFKSVDINQGYEVCVLVGVVMPIDENTYLLHIVIQKIHSASSFGQCYFYRGLGSLWYRFSKFVVPFPKNQTVVHIC